MIGPELNEAIESACSGYDHRITIQDRRRVISREKLESLLRNIVRDLPDEMTVQDIREQLEE